MSTLKKGRGVGLKTQKTMVKSQIKDKGNGRSTRSSVKATMPEKDIEQETPYERLYRKVVTEKNKRTADAEVKQPKAKKVKGGKTDPKTNTNPEISVANFGEDGNFIDMAVTEEQHNEFPSEDEFREDNSSDSEIEFATADLVSSNNNALRMATESMDTSAARLPSSNSARVTDIELLQHEAIQPRQEPTDVCKVIQKEASTEKDHAESSTSTGITADQSDIKAFHLMQNFMLQKGWIDRSMMESEVRDFINTSNQIPAKDAPAKDSGVKVIAADNKGKRKMVMKDKPGNVIGCILNNSPSDVTIYKRALPSVTQRSTNEEIDEFI